MRSESSSNEQLTYSSLIQKVGSKGCYQWIIYVLVFLYWVENNFILSSISFIFMNPGFDCTTLGVTKIDCEEYVCLHIDPTEQYLYEG